MTIAVFGLVATFSIAFLVFVPLQRIDADDE